MLREGMTRLEAAQMWVNGFNAVPTRMIAKLMQADPDDWCEVTLPTVGDRVYVLGAGSGKVIEVFDVIETYEETLCKVELDRGSVWYGHISLIEAEYDDVLPMWGTMWSFSDSCDEHWFDDDEDGIMAMSQCGFRIFRSFEFGYFFGIDGAGYDFYESHWLPLYKARGLEWHSPKIDEVADDETEK